jgi:CRP-like cAMP-binding protein
MEEILRFLNLLHPMSAELQVFIMQVFQKEIHRPNKIILDAGQICDWIGFVETGLLKAYVEMEGDSEKVIWYRKAGEVISSISCFHDNQPWSGNSID